MTGREPLLRLREHLRRASAAYTMSHNLLVDLVHPRPTFLLARSPAFHKPEAAAYLLLMSARMHWRAVDAVAKQTGHGDLRGLVAEIESQFPDYKDARDALEHLEEYAVGAGRFKHLRDMSHAPGVTLFVDDRGWVEKIGVFELTPIALSQFAWLADASQFHAERVLHEALHPGEEWRGYWPMYDHTAPTDWARHDWHDGTRFAATMAEIRAQRVADIDARLTAEEALEQALQDVVRDLMAGLSWPEERARSLVWVLARDRLVSLLDVVGSEPSWWTARWVAEAAQRSLLLRELPLTWPTCPTHGAQHRLTLDDDGRQAHWLCPFERTMPLSALGTLPSAPA